MIQLPPAQLRALLKQYAHRPISRLAKELGCSRFWAHALYRRHRVKRPRGKRRGIGSYKELSPAIVSAAIQLAPQTDETLAQLTNAGRTTVAKFRSQQKIRLLTRVQWMKARGQGYCRSCDTWCPLSYFSGTSRICRDCRSGHQLVNKFLEKKAKTD